MKKILLLSTLALALGYTSNAQQNKPAKAAQATEDISKLEVAGIPISVYVQSETNQMTKELSLDDVQSKKMYEANQRIAIKASHAERLTDAKQARDAKMMLAKYKTEEFQKILTKEQYTKWQNAHGDSAVN